MKQAEIITIGDEILIGQIVDTNSAWMAERLNKAGIKVAQITSIPDQSNAIKLTLDAALERADIVLITGGLGPTRDDVTKQTLADYFGLPLEIDPATLAHVEAYFNKLNRPMLAANVKQAEVPKGCTVIKNKNGTAPCMWFEKDGKIFVSMPGVPFEMKYLIDEEVIPRLVSRFALPHIVHKTILTANIGESFLAALITDIEDQLPAYISLAYLPKLGQVRLRLSGVGKDRQRIEAEVEQFAQQIMERTSQYLIADIDTTLYDAAVKKLIHKNLTLSTAESCTGGLVGHLLTSVEGSSEVYAGGGITYTNEMKHKLLGVKWETLKEFGAVSEETAKEMALGAQKRFNSDYAIATTGIAGPGGAEAGKPVGTIWIALAYRGEVSAKLLSLNGRRQQNIERTAMSTFIMLLNHLKNQAK